MVPLKTSSVTTRLIANMFYTKRYFYHLKVPDEGIYWCYVDLNRETRVQDFRVVLATGT